MDIKKSHTDTKSKKVFVEFGKEIKQELQKVEWTTKDELTSYTKIVVISTFLFGLGVYLIDLFIQGCLGIINMLFKVLTGS